MAGTTHRRLTAPPVVEIDEHAGGTLVRVVGRVDVHSAADLRLRLHAIIDGSDGPLLLDLAEAMIADATALGLLLECHRRGMRRGHPMRLVAADERCQRLLRRLALRRHSLPARTPA